MTDLEGGRHSYDDIQLEFLDNVGLPDPVEPVVVRTKRKVVGTRKWTSEVYSGLEIDIYEELTTVSGKGAKS